MDEYPLIVVPEWDYLETKFRKELLSYAEKGGKLLLIGPRTVSIFKKELGIRLMGKPTEKEQWLEYNGFLCGLKTLSQKFNFSSSAATFGRLYPENDTEGSHESAATISKYGKGKIAAIYVNLGQRYCNGQTSVIRDFLCGIVRKLFPKPMVEVSGSHHVDIVISRKNDHLILNLVNTAGPHSNPKVYTYDEVPAIGPLDIVIRTGYPPHRVTHMPGGRKLKYQYKSGEIRLKLRRLVLYDIIVVK